MTKLTVMYGGPYYTTEVDSEREGGVTTSSRTSSFSLDKLLESLFKQLGKPRMEPIHVEVYHQQDCIPTFLVGHVERMEEMRKVLGQSPWEGRLHVTGAGVDGVGIADCVAAGRKMALSL
jgi:oxygen-dependent protoporphyrinogen oxidase